jgi:peroxiredoxin
MARTESNLIELGSLAPDFSLSDVVSGAVVRRDDFVGKKALLVAFICAHCPYVKHIEKGLARLAEELKEEPIGIVAISSNDVAFRPEDSPANLKAQAVATGFNFPYLYDESQEVARTFGAACTPDFFLYDAEFKLVYHGQFDSSRPGNGIPVTGEDVQFSISQVLADKPVPKDQQPSVGCNIKWKA